MKVIILAGGAGVRLWPLSQQDCPKQFLKIGSSQTLFQEAIRRSSLLVAHKDIYIVAEKCHLTNIKEQAGSEIPSENIIEEPKKLNTAPAIACAIKYLQEIRKVSADELCFVFPSDHIIHNDQEFVLTMKKASESAQNGYFVVCGVKPDKAEVGYGYIKKSSEPLNEMEYRVDFFIEKPDQKSASKFLQSPDFLWNTGIFVFTIKTLLNEFRLNSPEIFELFSLPYDFFLENFKILPSISLDYALLEKSKNITVVTTKIKWSDVGSWDSVYNISPKDCDGNAISGSAVNIKGKNNLIMAGNKKVVVTIGVDDLLIIDTQEGLLVTKKDHSVELKQAVEVLKNEQESRNDVKSTVGFFPREVNLSEENSTEKIEPMSNNTCKAIGEICEQRVVNPPWGSYSIIDERKGVYKVKKIIVNKGQKNSLQFHYHRCEHYILIKGVLKVFVNEKEILLYENEHIYIPLGAKHRVENVGKITAELIEVQIGSYLEEDDIIRLEDIYGRI